MSVTVSRWSLLALALALVLAAPVARAQEAAAPSGALDSALDEAWWSSRLARAANPPTYPKVMEKLRMPI